MDAIAAMEAAMNRLSKGQSAGEYKHIRGFNQTDVKVNKPEGEEDEPTGGLGSGAYRPSFLPGMPEPAANSNPVAKAMAAAAAAAAAAAKIQPPAPAASSSSAVPPVTAPVTGRVRKRRTFSEGPPGDAPTAPATQASGPGDKEQAQLEIADKLSDEERALARKARRKSKWDVAGPAASVVQDTSGLLDAPTAAQLSSCNNPYEIKQYVDSLSKANQDYVALQKERQDNASKRYATGNMMETEDGTGVHHFDHFIPAEQLAKFQALATGKKEEPKPAQIDMSNKGAMMMAKMGFTAGQGLGAAGTGMTSAIDAGMGNALKLGVGVAKETWEPTEGDDSFSLYRKRMMLGYKHRPNPLNNPRSTYY